MKGEKKKKKKIQWPGSLVLWFYGDGLISQQPMWSSGCLQIVLCGRVCRQETAAITAPLSRGKVFIGNVDRKYPEASGKVLRREKIGSKLNMARAREAESGREWWRQ